ncbi:hypothetical protein [Ancylobacter radicis]|uniref:DUF4150 domain-containing protein n=1 Tax=Ancylobacter radicis TaxID=2836179 RepID=A0ABS5R4R6_9HYPH|nr:hypothetical protein [Ancylobacter radicis]MBS9476195.1 hypothetical protein [Ancylobacter radicis]
MRKALLALACLSSLPAAAHQAPGGWSYDMACCSGQDCRPVEPGEVTASPNGYEVAPTGEVVPFNSPKVRPSGDGAMHRCMHGGVTTAPTICIYVPGGV